MQNRSPLHTLFASLVFCAFAVAQTQPLAIPQPQIIRAVDENRSVTLAGNVHPLTAAASVSAEVDPSTPMQHMVLHLKGSAAQEAALDQLLAAQNDPKSPLYHKYLTPQAFASQFGAAPSDIAKVTAWLESHGMNVEQAPAGNRALVFSGTAGQVNNAFQTEIRQYNVAGVNHLANATDPKIPEALSGAIAGVVKLHDFRHSPHAALSKMQASINPTNPQYTNGSAHNLTPADYAIIYDLSPLYTAGINGTGQSIAVIARSNIYLSDAQNFRNTFGLKANDPKFIITNSDPGVLSGDSVETSLDTEWSGAVAPNATIKVIISSSGTSDGIDLSSLYAVNNYAAPIITLSYGSCEAGMGSSELSFYNALWKQAASQGQSVMVSAGDSSAAGCDNPNSSSAVYGRAINGLCSSPYATCVGGTQFADTTNPGQYWLPNNTSTYGSAISYIPETVWNESGSVSGGSGLWGGGGGASIYFTKPSWQAGKGVPADGMRDVPDVSLSAASHDGYFIAYQGGFWTVGGTSAAAPSFAGMVALVDQKMNAPQGLLNATLYPLATKQASGGAAVFHDTINGNNSVPGVTGYLATVGYDLASGLGSVDANLLVNHWTDASSPASTLSLSALPTSLTLGQGQTTQITITSTASASLKSAVTLAVTGAPAGLTVTFASPTIASPGSGTDVLKAVASSTLAAGTYNLTVTGSGGGLTATVLVPVVVTAPNFALSASATSLSVAPGASGSVSLTVTPQNGFNSAVALSVSGLPTGVTATFTPATISGAGTSALKLTAASTTAAGSHTLTLTGTSGSLKQTATVSLVVSVPSLAITASLSSLTLPVSTSASLTVTATQNGVTSAFSVTGLPSGVTAVFSPTTLSASGTTTLNFTAGPTVTGGTYPLTITGAGGGLTSKASVSLVIPSASFTLAAAATSVSVMAGNTGQVGLTITPQNGFKSTITLSVAGVPAGVSAPFAPGTTSGAFILSLMVTSQTNPGTYPITISASGGGITKTVSVNLVVTPAPTCALASNPASLTLSAGLSGTAQLSCGSPTGTFSGPLAVTVSGAPTGMTAQLSAGTLTPGSTINLNISSIISLAGGTRTLAVTVSGSGFTRTLNIPVTIVAQNTLTLTASQMQYNMAPGATSQVTLTTLALGAFNSPVAFTTASNASGLTVSLSKNSLPAPGSGLIVATITAASNLSLGNYVVQVTAIGGNVNETAYIGVQIANGPGFTFTVNTSALTIHPGSSGSFITSSGNYTGGFSGQMSVTVTGLPTGANYGVTGANAANNLVNITYGITAASTTPVGTYPVTITATGGGITHAVTVQLTIAK
jgi:subtilase family serine protease